MNQWKLLSTYKNTEIKDIKTVIKLLLKNRGIIEKKELDEFLDPKINLVTVESVGIQKNETEKAIHRIQTAIKNNEGIVIYGDYDVDGVCATAILWETLYSVYKQSLPPSEIKNVYPYIPHRIDEGYGLSEKGIDSILSDIKNVGLIITVDNGIVAHASVAYASKKGIDVIITDHHVKDTKIPDALAIIHTTELCGTGIAYLFSQEICKALVVPEISSHLELVALATVADLVPLNKFNRTLLKFGLDALRKTKRLGLLSLFDEAQIKKEEIGAYQIGHMIAPRLNASGRISHALDSLRLICTTDKVRALNLAKTVGDINRERQHMTMQSSEHAITSARALKTDTQKITFVESPEYEQGVIGLIASRLVEEFYKPAIAVSVGTDISKGSARSIPGVNIIELIRSCSEFLSEAGGHPMAAGFSLKTSLLEKFKQKILKKAEEIDASLFEKVIKIDLELPFHLISLDLYQEIQNFEPFGIGNPLPVFMTKGVSVISANSVGKNSDHLQLVVGKDGYVFKGIKFRIGKNENPKKGEIINIVYSIELNEWNGSKKVELKVKDFTV